MTEKRAVIKDARKKPYTIIENWLFDLELTVAEKMVYIYLCSWANSNTIAPSQARISAKTSVSIASVKRALECLRTHKLIRTIDRKGDTSIYIICDPTTSDDDVNKVAHGELPPEDSSPGAGVSSPGARGSSQGATPIYKTKKQNIRTTTTDVVVISDGLKNLAARSDWAKYLSDKDLTKFIRQHGHDEVFHALDVLIETYRKSGKPIRDPAALLAGALREGVTPPEGFIPFHEREERSKAIKQAEDTKRKHEEAERAAEEARYLQAESELEALSSSIRDIFIQAAKKAVSPLLANNKRVIYPKAYDLMKGAG